MFFDLHSDILYHIVVNRLDHKRNVIRDYHLKELLKGKITGGIWCYYTDIERPLCEFERAIDFILEELESCRDVIQIVRSKDDFHDHKLNVILGFESIQPIDDLKSFEQYIRVGFRHAMLTWNEANHFATGVDGPDHRGLTELGREVIRYMAKNHIIIDVSHANSQTFYDIAETTDVPLLASHSNMDRLKYNRRNLTDDQVDIIINRGGLIGLTAVPSFISLQNANLNDFIQHFNYLRDQNRLDHVGIGFDFMHYIGGRNLPDLHDPTDTPKLIEKFNAHGYSKEQIQQIASGNAIRFIRSILT